MNTLKALGWREYKNEKGMDSIDFHYLNQLLAGIRQESLDETSMDRQSWTHRVEVNELDEFREERRLSSPWHWRLYFALDPPSHAVTDNEWAALKAAAKVSVANLKEALRTLISLGSATGRDVGDQVMSRVIFSARNEAIEEPVRWLQAVIANAAAFKETSKVERHFGFDKEFDIRVKEMTREIFRIANKKERSEALHVMYCVSGDLGVSAAILREQFAAMGDGDSADIDRVYLTREELKTAVKCQTDQFASLKPEDLLRISSPYDVLYAWKEVTGSSDGPGKLLKSACESQQGLLDTLSALRYVTSSEQNNVPHVPSHFLKNFIDVGAVKSRLECLANTEGEYCSEAQELLRVWWSGV